MIQQLVYAALHVKERASTTAALATLHGVDGNGGIDAEREGLSEEFAVDQSNVESANLAFEYLLERLFRVRGHPQSQGIVVSRSHRNHSNVGSIILGKQHQPIHCFVNDAVSAYDHESIALGTDLGSHVDGMASALS